jgi:periplasmic divalent cation tolerance protein
MMLLVYTTHPNKEHAQKIVAALLEEQLIVCANVFPVTSSYKWEGEIKQEDEVVAILKTTEANWEKVKKNVEELHEYKVPCILRWGVESNEAFARWVDQGGA